MSTKAELHSQEQTREREPFQISIPPQYTEIQHHETLLPQRQIPSRHEILAKPIVVPRVCSKMTSNPRTQTDLTTEQTHFFMMKNFSPFVRSYSPALAELPNPISKQQFLEFIDGLNSAYVCSPLLQVAHLAGGGLLATQIPPVQAVGGIFQIGSVALSAGISILRMKSFLKEANATLFAPRNLVVKVMSTQKMMAEIECTAVDAKGKLLLPPLDVLADLVPAVGNPINHGTGTPAPAAIVEDPRMRRLRALDGYIAPLELESTPAMMRGAWDRYGGAPLRWLNKRKDTKFTKAANISSAKRRGNSSLVETEMAFSDRAIQEIEQKMVEVHQRAHASSLHASPGERDQIQDRAEEEINALEASRAMEIQRRDSILAEIFKKGDQKLIKLAKNEEKVANKILWVVVSKLTGYTDDELLEVESLESVHIA